MYNHLKIDMARTGENIMKLRRQRKLSVKELQEMLGLTSPQSIYKWQRGEALPNVDNLVVLAGIFGVQMEELLVMEGSDQVE